MWDKYFDLSRSTLLIHTEEFMKKFVLFNILLLALATAACTYNVSMAHTEGQAEDVIDDTASNNPNVSPSLSIPVKAP